MKITLQYFDGCPNWNVLNQRIAEVTHGRPEVTITHQLIETHEEAVRPGFHGSPTILIDGTDPFAEDNAPTGLACRVYRTPDGPAGSPTIEQLRTALAVAAQKPKRGALHIGPLGDVPIACTLTPSAGKDQVERWKAFDDHHLLNVERTETMLVVHYAKTEESSRRLRELVAVESACCSFVDWSVEAEHEDLRLKVTGTSEQLAAFSIG